MGTIRAVAMDKAGNLAAGTSTGRQDNKGDALGRKGNVAKPLNIEGIYRGTVTNDGKNHYSDL